MDSSVSMFRPVCMLFTVSLTLTLVEGVSKFNTPTSVSAVNLLSPGAWNTRFVAPAYLYTGITLISVYSDTIIG